MKYGRICKSLVSAMRKASRGPKRQASTIIKATVYRLTKHPFPGRLVYTVSNQDQSFENGQPHSIQLPSPGAFPQCTLQCRLCILPCTQIACMLTTHNKATVFQVVSVPTLPKSFRSTAHNLHPGKPGQPQHRRHAAARKSEERHPALRAWRAFSQTPFLRYQLFKAAATKKR